MSPGTVFLSEGTRRFRIMEQLTPDLVPSAPVRFLMNCPFRAELSGNHPNGIRYIYEHPKEEVTKVESLLSFVFPFIQSKSAIMTK